MSKVDNNTMSNPFRCPIHNMPDCSPLLNGCSIPNQVAARVDATLAIHARVTATIREQIGGSV
jgi:hypothetical protein